MKRLFKLRRYLLILMAWMVMGMTPLAWSGIFDSISDTIKKTGDNISQEIQEVGSKVGLSPAKQPPPPPALPNHHQRPELLPAGVSHRIQKINQELDMAQNAMNKVFESASTRNQLAHQHLQKAERYQTEIEKRYSGKYDPVNPRVRDSFARLAQIQSLLAGEQASARQERIVKQVPASKRAMPVPKPAPATAAKPSATVAVSPQAGCDAWTKKFQAFTQGDKALHVYATSDSALMTKWKGYYDEADQLKQQFSQTPSGKAPCSRVKGELELLARYMENFEAIYANYSKKLQQTAANRGRFVFSKTPINPDGPANLTTTFEAGDHIYGLIQTTKPWSQIYKNKNNASVRVDVTLDGKKIHAQFIQIKKNDYMQRRYLNFEIAPDPERMTAYGDPALEYGKTTAAIRQGPNELSHHLSKLAPGQHSMAFKVAHYGGTYASGQFDIAGGSYDTYADLHKRIAANVASAVTLPGAKRTDPPLAAEMENLVQKAGGPKVYRLNIVDKDWWIDRTSGGNSPVKSRHMAAAVLACGEDGQYYYQTCTFHQDRLITGGFGKLYLSHQGQKVPLPKANIDK